MEILQIIALMFGATLFILGGRAGIQGLDNAGGSQLAGILVMAIGAVMVGISISLMATS